MIEMDAVFRALGDPTRLAVFQCIRGCGGAANYDTERAECDGGTPNAVALCDVRCRIPCAPSTLSHHLAVLQEAGLIDYERKGRTASVRVREEALAQIAEFVSLAPVCLPPLKLSQSPERLSQSKP